MMNNSRNVSERQASGYRNLWWAVLRKAVEDLSHHGERSWGAREFLMHDKSWFPFVCEFAGTTPEYIRKGVKGMRGPLLKVNPRRKESRGAGR